MRQEQKSGSCQGVRRASRFQASRANRKTRPLVPGLAAVATSVHVAPGPFGLSSTRSSALWLPPSWLTLEMKTAESEFGRMWILETSLTAPWIGIFLSIDSIENYFSLEFCRHYLFASFFPRLLWRDPPLIGSLAGYRNPVKTNCRVVVENLVPLCALVFFLSPTPPLFLRS